MAVPTILRPLPDAPPLTDPEAVRRAYVAGRWLMLVGTTLVYSFYYVGRCALDVLKKPLVDANIFNAAELGKLGFYAAAAYGVGKLVNGFIADRVNVARFLPLGLFLSALTNLAMGANTSFVVACVLWCLNGYFQGVGAATSVRSLTQWFSGAERGRVYGLWSGAHSGGEGLTLIGSAALIAHTSWHAGFIAPGVACAAVALIAALVLKDRPQAYGLPEVHDFKGEPHTDHTPSTRAAQLEILKRPALWICAIASAFMYVTRFGIKSWGVYYLQESTGLALLDASLIIAVNAISGFLGSALYGVVSDKLFNGRRPPATLLFGIVEIASLLVFFFGPKTVPVMVASLFVYGFALSGILAVLGGLFAVDMSSKKAAGFAMGFVGFISYIGGAANQELVAGHLINANTTVVDGVKHVDFSAPIALWIGASVISMLLAATLWNVKPRE
jgi:OPA family sugar phosphate sensor protein UhpC-like MFS transporter